MIQHLIALVLKCLGFKPNYSTGIHNKETCGYGKLDSNGFFKYPLY